MPHLFSAVDSWKNITLSENSQHFTNPAKKVEFSCQGFLRILIMRILNRFILFHHFKVAPDLKEFHQG